MKGKLLIVSAPSGAGKTTIVKELLNVIPNLKFSVSATSRSKRDNETDGKDYYYLSVSEFKNKIKNDEFLEWEEVYKNQFYGTFKSEIERIWHDGNHVVFDVDVQGGLNIKKQYKKKSLSIFIMPPSLKVLENRLKARQTESKKTLKARTLKARQEIMQFSNFDKVIVNDDLKSAFNEAKKMVSEFLSK